MKNYFIINKTIIVITTIIIIVVFVAFAVNITQICESIWPYPTDVKRTPVTSGAEKDSVVTGNRDQHQVNTGNVTIKPIDAHELIYDPPITNSDMLCPFIIEVYPKEFQAGDVVYMRMNFENTTDHPVWAPALPLNGYRLEHGILSYYFGDKKGNEHVWKQYHKKGEFLWNGTWEEILPGQKGLTQYEMIEYYRTRYLECWDEIKTNGTIGRLMVRLKYVKKPPQPQIDVVFPSLDIRPRPRKEMELIENFMSSEKYQATNSLIITAGHAGTDYKQGKGVTVEEMQGFCDQISQGTLKNFIQYQTFLLELILQTIDKNETEQMKTMEKIGKWLKPLPELEQENLKIYAKYLRIQDRFRWQNHPEKLMECFTSAFGEPYPRSEVTLMK